MPVAQANNLQTFIKSAMLSSEYADFFGLAAPAMDQTVSRSRLKAMLRYHTMFHASPKAYLDDSEPLTACLQLEPAEASGIVKHRESSSVALNVICFLGRTESAAQNMHYPQFLWDQTCYRAYFKVTLTSLRKQMQPRNLGPECKRCLDFTTIRAGDVIVGMANPEGLHQKGNDGYVSGVVQAKFDLGGHHDSQLYVCCPWKIGYETDYTLEPRVLSTEVHHWPELWMSHELSAHHSLTCLARHFWSACSIQRAWRKYLEACSLRRIAQRITAIEQELLSITLHPSRLMQHVDIETARRISSG